jgi:hypothetical protein
MSGKVYIIYNANVGDTNMAVPESMLTSVGSMMSVSADDLTIPYLTEDLPLMNVADHVDEVRKYTTFRFLFGIITNSSSFFIRTYSDGTTKVLSMSENHPRSEQKTPNTIMGLFGNGTISKYIVSWYNWHRMNEFMSTYNSILNACSYVINRIDPSKVAVYDFLRQRLGTVGNYV